ncbi:MAG TPA: undecaprenyl-diphosphate phosphatase [Candidatus Eisenbacteria bacterium]|nr:undecaprenyl-diphosphate phosphatase [Candidatus Eisenbacteria bacterium]
MNLFQAAILGAVEGLTEFLPVSSTGHLILAAHAMGLVSEAMDAFEIVIQAGALLAVLWLYRDRVASLFTGLAQPNSPGRALLLKLIVAFIPAAALGFVSHKWIKAHLFGPRPVAIALIAGGLLILFVARWMRARDRTPGQPARFGLDDLPISAAVLIGLAQCFSLWPGTSRAMTTILAALVLGATPVAAAEFSFLLALPTLGAATLFDLLKHHDELTGPAIGGPGPLIVGLVVSAIVAAIAIRGFLRYVTSRGLEPFGWYRIVLGIVVIALLWHHGAAAIQPPVAP